MRTYWFTVAEGSAYQAHAECLKRSLASWEIQLDVLTSSSSRGLESKRRKLRGILDAPADCDRIVYLDADTLVLDPRGIEEVNGSWRIPWRMPAEGCIPRSLDPCHWVERLEGFYQEHGLSTFAGGGALEGVEWNSGVIVGDRQRLVTLANEWALWWSRIQELFQGRFRRDQVSYRIAYHQLGLDRENTAGLPAEYNWIVSYFGVNPNAHILHRTMVRSVPWLEEEWQQIVADRLAGKNPATANRSFDLSAVSTDRPPLERRTDLDRGQEAALLRQTLAFARPKKALLCGIESSDDRFLPLVREYAHDCIHLSSLDRLPPEVDLTRIDLILFCSVDYRVREQMRRLLAPDAICCFAGLHHMALYRHLYQFSYVRILAHGFGLFSQSPRITTWEYRIRAGRDRGTGA